MLVDDAMVYHDCGYSLIPISQSTKRPLIKWKHHQKYRATKDQLIDWFQNTNDNNIGIVTGRISNLTVLDFDNVPQSDIQKLIQLLDIPTAILTGSRKGFHLYTQYRPTPNIKQEPLNQLIAQVLNLATPQNYTARLDVKNDGAYVLAPPSTTTNPYTFHTHQSITSFHNDLNYMPQKIYNALLAMTKTPHTTSSQSPSLHQKTSITTLLNTPIGSRNNTAAKFTGIMLNALKKKHHKKAWDILKLWNTTLQNPLPEQELFNTFVSIHKKHYAENK